MFCHLLLTPEAVTEQSPGMESVWGVVMSLHTTLYSTLGSFGHAQQHRMTYLFAQQTHTKPVTFYWRLWADISMDGLRGPLSDTPSREEILTTLSFSHLFSTSQITSLLISLRDGEIGNWMDIGMRVLAGSRPVWLTVPIDKVATNKIHTIDKKYHILVC